MSVRRQDVSDVTSAASAFSLRNIVTQETVGLQQPLNGGFKFSIGNDPKQKNRAPAVAPIASTPTPVLSKPSTANVFKLGPGGTGASADNSEVMRLTAYVEDLSKRLRDASTKLQTTELALARSNQALIAERHSASNRIQKMRAELANSHDNESKLRAHIQAAAKGPSVMQQTQEYFLSGVRSVMRSNTSEEPTAEQRAAAEELEKRLLAMQEEQRTQEAIKEAAIEKQRAECATLEKQVQAMKAEHSALEVQITKLSSTKTAFESEISSQRHVITENEQKRSRVSSAVSEYERKLFDTQRALQTETARLSETKAEAAAVEAAAAASKAHTPSAAEIDFFSSCAPAELIDLHVDDADELDCTQQYDIELPSSPQIKRTFLWGSNPVSMRTPSTASCFLHAARVMPNNHLASHFNVDCPVTICDNFMSTNGAPSTQDATDALVYAIVEDTKAMLVNATLESSAAAELYGHV